MIIRSTDPIAPHIYLKHEDILLGHCRLIDTEAKTAYRLYLEYGDMQKHVEDGVEWYARPLLGPKGPDGEYIELLEVVPYDELYYFDVPELMRDLLPPDWKEAPPRGDTVWELWKDPMWKPWP